MGLFDRFRKKSTDSAPPYMAVWEYLSKSPPDRKGNAYLQAYSEISWVYAAVRLIAQNIAQTILRLYQIKNDGTWEEVDEHDALKFLRRPNPFLTKYDLFMITAQNLELVGEAFWLLLKDKHKNILGIVPLNPTRMELELDNGLPKRWIYGTERGNGVPLDPDDLVVFRYPNPINPYRGLSPLKAVAISGDTDLYASKWNRNFFYNAAAPTAVVKTDKPLTKEAFQRTKTQIQKMYQGLDNAHKVILLDNGLEFKPVQLAHKDMQFLELRKFTRTEIAAIFGVPLSKLGISEEVNRATAYINDYTFAKNTLTPKLKLIADSLNYQYLPHFGEGLVFAFDSVIPQDEEFETKKYIEFAKQGIMTINEIRDELGLPPVDWGDRPFNPNLLMNAGMEAPKKKSVDRLRYWRKIVQKQDQRENSFRGWVVARFQRQMKQLLARLEEKKAIMKETDAEINAKIEELLREILGDDERRVWEEFYREKVSEYVNEVSDEFAGEFSLPFVLTSDEPLVQDILEKRAQRFAKRVNDTTWKQLKQTLLEGYKAGEGIDELQRRVENVFTDAKRNRAATIARTELYSVMNEATVETMKKNGLQMKEWMTAGDERTRDDHAIADGQRVPINEPFIVGGESLQYPGDPVGSPGNIINCRCTILPVIE